MITCIAHIGSCDGAKDQENASMSPKPFSSQRVGSGNETIVPAFQLKRLGSLGTRAKLYVQLPFHNTKGLSSCHKVTRAGLKIISP